MRYYNQERLHSSNGDKSPVSFENSQIKVSCLG
jgi:putative transposase